MAVKKNNRLAEYSGWHCEWYVVRKVNINHKNRGIISDLFQTDILTLQIIAEHQSFLLRQLKENFPLSEKENQVN